MFRRDLALTSDGRAFVSRIGQDLPEIGPMPLPGLRGVDFERIRLILRRNRWLIALCLCVAVLAAAGLTAIAPRIYRATSSVQLEQQSTRVIKDDGLQPEASVYDSERFLQTQVDVLRSRALAIRVAERLDLFRDTHFLAAMGQRFEPEGAPADQARKLREQVLQALEDNLRISLPRSSRLAAISFSSRDPELAARVANAYAEALIADNLERRYKASSYARDFLQQQLGNAKAKLEASERAAIGYARSAGLIDTGSDPSGTGEHSRSLVTSSLVSMNDTLSALSAERLRAEQRWRRASNAPVMSLPEVLNNQAVQELARTRAELAADYRKELETHLPDFPTVRQAKAQLDEADAQIGNVANSIRDSIREAYVVALTQEQAAKGNVNGLRSSTLAEQQRGIQYGILRREVDTNRELYEGLLQRFKEVSTAAGITANNITIVDVAERPLRPAWPKLMLNLAIALVLGAMAAGALVFLREASDDTIRGPDDAETKLGLSLLGTVPRSKPGLLPLEALEMQRSPLAESYSSLRTMLEFTGNGGVPRRLLVTSSQAAEGKSLSSYAIARSLATVGRRVLLVDGDLRRPSLAKLLGIEQETGFTSILAGSAQESEQVVALETPNLFFLPSGPLPPNPADLYGRARLKEVTARLAEQYDVLIIDGPPVLGLADAPLLSAAVDGVVFLVDASRSRRGRVKTALRRIERARGQVLGVVLMMFDPRSAGYDNYAYSYEYKGGEKPRRRLLAPVADRF